MNDDVPSSVETSPPFDELRRQPADFAVPDSEEFLTVLRHRRDASLPTLPQFWLAALRYWCSSCPAPDAFERIQSDAVFDPVPTCEAAAKVRQLAAGLTAPLDLSALDTATEAARAIDSWDMVSYIFSTPTEFIAVFWETSA